MSLSCQPLTHKGVELGGGMDFEKDGRVGEWIRCDDGKASGRCEIKNMTQSSIE